MASIRKRNGKFTVEIRKKYGQQIYRTFDRKSDALRFIKETEPKHTKNGNRAIKVKHIEKKDMLNIKKKEIMVKLDVFC